MRDVLFCALIVAVMFGGGWALCSYGCQNLSEVTGKPTKLVGLTCYVNPNGKGYVPERAWRVTDE